MLNKTLKVIRQYHRLSQTDLAKKINISTSYLSELESGKKDASIELLQRYSDFFNLPLSSLVVFAETIEGTQNKSKAKAFVSKKMLKILEWFAELNEEASSNEKKVSA
jgi:transcriptional regulator with XRE-family HTH domain